MKAGLNSPLPETPLFTLSKNYSPGQVTAVTRPNLGPIELRCRSVPASWQALQTCGDLTQKPLTASVLSAARPYHIATRNCISHSCGTRCRPSSDTEVSTARTNSASAVA